MKNITFLLFTALVLSQLLFFSHDRDPRIILPDSTSTLTISFVGDLMCHSPQFEYVHTAKDSFDFKPAFREVKKYLSASDITIGNLETTISGRENRFSGYPLFNSPDEYLDALKDAGFNLLLTANDHSMDRGRKGVLRTIEKLKSLGINSTGTFNSQKDRDSVRVLECNGIKIAFLAFTYGLNGNFISQNEKYLVNVIDTNLIKSDIATARLINAEVVLVYFHFGEEYQRKPNDYQKRIVKCAVDAGADLIIGSHPHVIQPCEYFTSEKNKICRGIIAYSLGNFFSNQRWRYSDAGAILNISLIKNTSTRQIKISNVSVIPTWVYKGNLEHKNEFVILPNDSSHGKYDKLLSTTDGEMIQSFEDTQKMFNSMFENSKNH